MLWPFGTRACIALHHHHGVVAHFLFWHDGFITHGQAQGGHQDFDRELRRHIFEVKFLNPFELSKHLFRNITNRLFQGQQIALHEGVLNQTTQAVVLWRI